MKRLILLSGMFLCHAVLADNPPPPEDPVPECASAGANYDDVWAHAAQIRNKSWWSSTQKLDFVL